MKPRSAVEAWVHTPDGRAQFMSYIRRDGCCLVWTHSKSRSGGPVWQTHRQTLSPRRIMWELQGIAIPEGRSLLNTCGNLLCLAHLVPGVNAPAMRTTCANGHTLAGENLVPSVTHERRCLICHRQQSRDAVRRYRARRREESRQTADV